MTTETPEALHNLVSDMSSELVNAKARIRELEAWKASSMAVENEWSCQDIGRIIDAPLGGSIRKAIMEKVPRMVETLKDIAHRIDYDPAGIWTLPEAVSNICQARNVAKQERDELKALQSAISDARLKAFKRIIAKQVGEAQRQVEASDKLNRDLLSQNTQMRESLVECRGELDRMGQEGICERADKILGITQAAS